MRTLHKLAITLAAPLVGLAMAEAIVRGFDLEPVPQPRWEGQVFKASDDERIRFENNPGGEQVIRYVQRNDAPPIEIVARVNAQGFRGPLVAQVKPTGVFRIACIGDSHTFGYGVGEGEPWPDVLARTLDGDLGRTRVEVLNCGVNAHDTEQEVEFLAKRVLAFQPDLVLLQFFLNDTAVRDAPGAQVVEQDWLLSLCHPWRKGFVRTLRTHVHFLDLAASSIYKRRHLADFGRTRSALFADDAEGWTRCRAALVRARDLLREADVGFAVVLFPFLFRQGEHLMSHDAFMSVGAFCSAQQITCFDLEPDFAGHDPDALRVHPLDYHANAQAHRIFAEGVAQRLLAERMLSGSPGTPNINGR